MRKCDSKCREICFNRAFIITRSRKIKQRNPCLPRVASRRLAASCLPFAEIMSILAESAEGGREIAKKQPTLVGSLK